jgi:hypothetical protein
MMDKAPQDRLRVESDGTVNASQEHEFTAQVSEDGSVVTTVKFRVTNISANSVFKFLTWGGIMPSQSGDLGIEFAEKQVAPDLKPSEWEDWCLLESKSAFTDKYL